MAKFDELVVIHPSSPTPLVFSTVSAVKVTAFGLQGNDCIHFLQVRETSARPKFERAGCQIFEPSENTVALSAVYAVGDCVPTLHAGRPSIYIAQPDKYLPVVVGHASDGGLLVVVEPVASRDFSAAELGVAPCGCPCVVSDWVWTGQERCNKGVIEREYRSNCGDLKWEYDRDEHWEDTGDTRCNDEFVEKKQLSDCGNVRWVKASDVIWEDTGEVRCKTYADELNADGLPIIFSDFHGSIEKKQVNDCGRVRWQLVRQWLWEKTGRTRCENHGVIEELTNPCGQTIWVWSVEKCGYSASLPFVVSDCNGLSQLAYAFSPDEDRDPDATVPLEDCEGVVHGYVYPSAGNGHTVALADCEGNVLGYLANRSASAADVVCVDCGHDSDADKLAVSGLSWSGHDLLMTMTDGTSRLLGTPVCD